MTELIENTAEIIKRLSKIRFNRECLLIALNCVIQLAEILESDAEVIVRFSVVRFNRKRLLIKINCCIQLS